MNYEDIIREAIAYTELYINHQNRRDIPHVTRYKQRKGFPSHLLAILNDEAY